MADKEDLNLGKGKDADGTAGKGGKRMLIIIVLLVLLAGGGAAAYFLLFASDGGDAAADAGAVVEEESREPLYVDVAKLLVNIEHKGRTRYVQAEMQLMSYDEDVIEQAERDMPAIRDRLIILFSGQDFEALKTVEGKEALRAAALATVNQALGLEPPAVIEAVYFENFVLQ